MIQIEAKRRKARVNASLSVLSGGCRTPLSLTMGTIIDHYKSLGKKMDLDELKTGISKGFYAQIHENFRMRFSSPFQQLLTILAQHAIRPKMPVKGLPRDSQLLA